MVKYTINDIRLNQVGTEMDPLGDNYFHTCATLNTKNIISLTSIIPSGIVVSQKLPVYAT